MVRQIEFTHTKKSVQRLHIAIWKSFRKKTIIFFKLTGLIIMLPGALLLGKNTVLGVCLILMGIILQFNWRKIPRLQAENEAKNIEGIKPTTYIFCDDSIGVSGSCLNYSEIIKLCHDRKYCYLFVGHESAYMFERTEDGELEKFISSKVGLGWVDLDKALSMSGRNITYERENTREEKDYLKWTQEHAGR